MLSFFNSFFDKIKKSLKAKILFILILILYITIIVITTVKLNKEIITPGELNKPADFITIGTEDNSYDMGNINTIGVYVTYQPTIFQYLIAQNKFFEISDYDTVSDLNPTNQYLRSKNLKNVSIQYALINAYTEANKIDPSITINYAFDGLLVTANMPNSYSQDLKIGDVIEGVIVDNQRYDLLGVESNYKSYFVSLIKSCFSLNQTFTLLIRRGSEKLEIEFKWNSDGQLGLELYPIYSIKSTNPIYTIDESKVYNSVGSSGGMMLTLSIFNSLFENDYTKGLMICGTGTVDENGEIGSIGGIRQKITTSQLYKADVFFCPYNDDTSSSEYKNYLEAYDEYKKIKNPTFEFVKVRSFSEVLDYLGSYGGNNA